MQRFINLFTELDQTTSTKAKEKALRAYFASVPSADAAWATYFLAGGNPRRLVQTTILRKLIAVTSDFPTWLFDECYHVVGDLAETIALLLPLSESTNQETFSTWIEKKLMPLRTITPEAQPDYLIPLLSTLDSTGKMLCLKLITGNFRVGVSKLTVTKAIASYAEIDPKLVAQRLVGLTGINHLPRAEDFDDLVAKEVAGSESRVDGLPYPFFLAHPIQLHKGQAPFHIGAPEHWLAEWKWDGIRIQMVKRSGKIWIWSRGEELITERFPELAALIDYLPEGTVVDGEIVVWQDQKPQSFALLQKRIGRLKVGAKLLSEAPTVIIAYDLLELEGNDLRHLPLTERRSKLELLINNIRSAHLLLSPFIEFESWDDLAELREQSRERQVEGLMLKQKASRYGVGRTKNAGVWWKWKIDPLTIDAVLIYAQRGQGRRASLYTDYTFAVWDKPPGQPDRQLLAFAKAYSGLTDAELKAADQIVRTTTIERFGPVATLTPTQVFEIGFEGIAVSMRHKSGISVRFPRILRWRHDKQIEEADTLAHLHELLL